MERKGEVTKRQLADSFKELMLKGLSESIRGDRTKRIRGDPVRQDPAAD